MNLNPNLDVFDTEKNAIWEIGQHGGRTRPINKDILFKNLCDVYDVFKKHDITCWLSHGTMLGVYRNKDFITYDDDADISAYMIDKDKALLAEEELRTLGFYVPPMGDPNKAVDFKSNMPYSDTVAIRDGEKVEVWWWTKQDDKYVYDPYRPPCELVHEEKYYNDIKDSIEFRGKQFNIPNYIDKWVVMMYGSDWNKPQEGVKYNNKLGRNRA